MSEIEINLVSIAKDALTSSGERKILFAGLGVLTLALMFRVGREYYRGITSPEPPNFIRPVAAIVVFAVLLLGYPVIVKRLLQTVDLLGAFDAASAKVSTNFYQRLYAYQQRILVNSSEGGWFTSLSAENFKLGLAQFFTVCSYMFVQLVVYLLQHIQVFTLTLVVNVGPLMLGFGSFGGAMSVLVLSWFWTLVEVSAWGITMTSVLDVLGKLPPSMVKGVSDLVGEAFFNLFYACMMISVPWITSKLVRSQAMGDAAGAMMLTVGAIKTAARSPSFSAAARSGIGTLATKTASTISSAYKAASVGGGTAAPRTSSAANASRQKHFAIKDAERKRRGD